MSCVHIPNPGPFERPCMACLYDGTVGGTERAPSHPWADEVKVFEPHRPTDPPLAPGRGATYRESVARPATMTGRT